jgi:glutamate/tyrosine decarboxylase-like PLP-dependent enzyme
MKKTAIVLVILCVVLLVVAAPACKKTKSGETTDEAEQAKLDSEQAAEAAAAEAAAKPVPPPPKMNDEVYIDIRARQALIDDKYKDDPALAQQSLDQVFEKHLVTLQEFRDFEAKQTPEHRAALEKKVMEFMQRILGEYR